MAVTDIKEAIKKAADTVAEYVRAAAELRVETQTLEAGGEPQLAARTVIMLDGDNLSIVPGRRTDAGKWEIDTVLYDLHTQNVQAAIDYRTRMVDSLLGLLRSR